MGLSFLGLGLAVMMVRACLPDKVYVPSLMSETLNHCPCHVSFLPVQCALGVLTLIEVHFSGIGEDLSEPFLASYMILFAVLLFMYELMWWTPMPLVNKALRKNFGFLYGLRGKGLYLIFAGCLCLGLGKDASVKTMNWATGIAFLVVGLLHWSVVCFYPEIALKYVAPTAGLIDHSAPEETTGNNAV